MLKITSFCTTLFVINIFWAWCDDFNSAPEVWLARDAPYCSTKAEHCQIFGFNYLRSDPSGNGDNHCETGTQVLCQSPYSETKLISTPANTINVLAYNIYDRNYFIAHDGQRERTCRIPYTLRRMLPDLDAIAFQEEFMAGCFPKQANIRRLLAQHGFAYHTDTIGSWLDHSAKTITYKERKIHSNKLRKKFPGRHYQQEGPKIMNGGIFIASRWPILQQKEYIFDISKDMSWDSVSMKGVSYAKINKTDNSGRWKLYNIFSTHLNTGSNWEVKTGQTTEMREFAGSIGIPKSEPVIYAGDFNVNLYQSFDLTAGMFKALRATVPPILGEKPCTVSNENDFKPQSHKCNFIDYVMYSNEFETPVQATQHVIRPKWTESFPICYDPDRIARFTYYWPDDPRCENKNHTVNDLSDHFAVLGRLTYK